MSVGFASALRPGRYPSVTDGPIRGAGSGGGGADPGLTLLESATLWLDASDMASGAQWLRNKGTGGRALDARVGSVGSAQIINGALKLPGLTGNSASTPDAAALDITGDLEMVFRAAPISWTVTQTLGGKWSGPGQKSYILYTEASTGKLWFWLSADGSTGIGALSSTGVTFGAGVAGWVKVTYRFSDKRVQFFTAADQASEPSSWTQLGTDVTHTIASATFNSTAPMWVGADTGTTNLFNGSIFRAIVRNGIGGTIVFDADFTAQSTLATSFTESSSNAATVTINSTSGVDTNDPLLLPHTGTNYLYLPGSTNNTCSTPDSAALDITGDIDLIFYGAAADWTPSSSQTLIAKRNSTVSYQLRVESSGGLLMVWSDGTTRSLGSTVPGFTDGQAYWVRCFLDVDNGAGQAAASFYRSDDGSSWTLISTATGSFGTSSLTAGTDPLDIGHQAGGFMFSGAVYRAQVWNGDSTSGGTKVFDADFTANTNQSSFTESSSNAATVTINRATSGRKAVMVVRPTLLFGTDDYLEVADNDLLDFALADSLSVVAVMRQHATPPSFAVVMFKRPSAGYIIQNNGTAQGIAVQVNDGTNAPAANSGNPSAGARKLMALVRDVAADQVLAYSGSTGVSTTDTTTATLANSGNLRIGATTSGTNYNDMELDTFVVFRSALTSAELDQIMSYLGVS